MVALHRVIDDHLLPTYRQDFKQFSEFRKYFYTLEVHDIFRDNLEKIKQVIKKFSGLGKNDAWTEFQENTMTTRDVKLMLKSADLNLPKRKIAQLFGLSKQTIVEINTQKGMFRANRLDEVEFLEFIGRLAMLKFLGTELEETNLSTKIGYILDEIFSTINAERNIPDEKVYLSSSSEDEW
jgi:hypothetical protein